MGIYKVIAATALLAFATSASAHCTAEHVHVETTKGTVAFTVDLAQTDQERGQGLMFVENMPTFHGMLFIFDEEAPRAFWMKNTLIPLDIVFFDGAGDFVSMAENAIPGDLTGLPSDGPAKYVLEVNAGQAKRFGFASGTQIFHPNVGPLPERFECAN